MGGIYSAHSERNEVKFWFQNLVEREYFEDENIDGREPLTFILGKDAEKG
jgi:hypothetical protein